MSAPLRVAVIGCVESTRVAMQTLLDMPADRVQVVGVVTRRGSSFNADFADITPMAQARDVAVLYAEDAPSDAEQAEWLSACRPDLLCCIGWSYLLGEQVRAVAPGGAIGFHPAALPANRGRHPLIWALALGLDKTASSFFMIEAEADSGALLDQVPIDIAADEDAASLCAKVLAVIPDQLQRIMTGLAHQTLQPLPQQSKLANHWRKRSARDGLIDWRMSANSVFNLVRALARPYPGAEFLCDGQPVKLWQCELAAEGSRNIEPGKVLRVEEGRVTVKCGEGAVRLLEHALQRRLEPGEYL